MDPNVTYSNSNGNDNDSYNNQFLIKLITHRFSRIMKSMLVTVLVAR
jgi:hypothetical protein